MQELTYDKILADPYVQRVWEFYEMSSKHNDKVNHGIHHALRVMSRAERAAEMLRLSGEQINAVKIAALLHDIGVNVSGKDGHAERSREWAKDYFAQHAKSLKANVRDDILDAILHHSTLCSEKVVGKVVAFADKLAICKDRLLPLGRQFKGVRQYAHVNNVVFYLDGQTINVKFYSDGELDLNELTAHFFVEKTFTATKKLAEHFKYKWQIFMNDKIWVYNPTGKTFNE